MKVLIACECSGVVRRAFRARGHDAWSCDLLPASDGSPFHYQCDIVDLLIGEEMVGCGIRHGTWEAMIAHPPCDYLTNSAAWAFHDPDFDRYPGVGYHQKVKLGTLTGEARRIARRVAVEFFLTLWKSKIPRIAIENPVGHMNTHPEMPGKMPHRQIIQPHQFGEDASKGTCLWLKGLPPLRGTKDIAPRIVNGRPRWANQTDSGQNHLSPSEDRATVRAITYAGIADAMAVQWGNSLTLDDL